MAAQHVKFSSEVSEEDWKYLRVPHQLDDRTRALFEQYARVPPEEVLDHVCTMVSLQDNFRLLLCVC